MSLQRKILLTLGAGLVLTIVISQFIMMAVQRPMLDDLIEHQAHEDLNRATDTLDREILHLDVFCHDWAAWSEMQANVARPSAKFLRDNFTSPTLPSAGVDLAMALRRDGSRVVARIRTPGAAEYRDARPGEVGFLEPALARFRAKSGRASVRGLLNSPNGVMMVSVQSIYNPAIPGSENGVLVMARYLDAAYIQTLATQVHVPFGWTPMGDAAQSGLAPGELEQLTSGSAAVMDLSDPRAAHAATLLRNLGGAPLGVILVHVSPLLINSVTGMNRVVGASLIIKSLLILLLILVLLRRIVLRPVVELRDVVRRLRHDSDLSLRCEVRGNDEFAMLASQFNRLLDQLQAARFELIAARDEAQRATMAKSAFLATLSHEIRNPLNGVSGMLALLADTPLDSVQRDYVEIAETSAESLLGVVNNVLDFSQIEAERTKLDTVPFELEPLLRETMAMLQHIPIEKGLATRLQIAPEVPRIVHGDPLRLRQVVLNLYGNALKYTDDGEVKIEVGFAGETAKDGQPDRHLRFAVTDSGIGIPPERISEIFRPFAQVAPTAAQRFGGTGLGLAISRQLVELMGGRIGVERSETGGSVFWFELPIATPAARESFAGDASNRPATPVPSAEEGAPAQILLAEDNVINQKVVRRILSKLGQKADVVEDGRAVLDALARRDYALLLLDCQMPVLDGYRTAELIRQREAAENMPRLPIIAMTADSLAGDRERCLAAGMDDFLSKPVAVEELSLMLARHLTKSSSSSLA